MCSGIALRRFDVAVPKHDETIIFRPRSSSSPRGPPFVVIATFLLVLHRCHLIQLDAIFVLVLILSPVGRYLLHKDVLTLTTEVFHLGKISLLMLLVNILRTPLTFSFWTWGLNFLDILTISLNSHLTLADLELIFPFRKVRLYFLPSRFQIFFQVISGNLWI